MTCTVALAGLVFVGFWSQVAAQQAGLTEANEPHAIMRCDLGFFDLVGAKNRA